MQRARASKRARHSSGLMCVSCAPVQTWDCVVRRSRNFSSELGLANTAHGLTGAAGLTVVAKVALNSQRSADQL